MPPKSTRQILDESHRIGVQFLLTDISAAMTFLDVADTTQSQETRGRNHQLAMTAYETVLRLLPKVIPSEHEWVELQTRFAALRDRLISLGYLTAAEDSGPSPS